MIQEVWCNVADGRIDGMDEKAYARENITSSVEVIIIIMTFYSSGVDVFYPSRSQLGSGRVVSLLHTRWRSYSLQTEYNNERNVSTCVTETR